MWIIWRIQPITIRHSHMLSTIFFFPSPDVRYIKKKPPSPVSVSPSFTMARISLRHGLDRDVYQIVKKLEEERDGEWAAKKDRGDGKRKKPKLTVTAVYEAIKKSNSSLSRQKRRPLEDAIERVLDFRKEEEAESEDSDDLLEQAEKAYKVSFNLMVPSSSSTHPHDISNPPCRRKTAFCLTGK